MAISFFRWSHMLIIPSHTLLCARQQLKLTWRGPSWSYRNRSAVSFLDRLPPVPGATPAGRQPGTGLQSLWQKWRLAGVKDRLATKWVSHWRNQYLKKGRVLGRSWAAAGSLSTSTRRNSPAFSRPVQTREAKEQRSPITEMHNR